ncbi:MAG: hypothetical protein ABSC11_00820 [Smithella sp.]
MTASFDYSIIQKLEQVDWDNVYPRLLRYATYKCKKFEWLGTATFDPGGMAHEAVALVFGLGKDGNYRNWNRNKYPDIAKFLEGVVDSLVNHEYEKTKTFKMESMDCENQTSVDNLRNSDSSVRNYFDCFSVTDPATELEMKENILRMVTSIRQATDGDETANMVVTCLEQGMGKPREIADEIGIDVTEVYQILRRIREKISK